MALKLFDFQEQLMTATFSIKSTQFEKLDQLVTFLFPGKSDSPRQNNKKRDSRGTFEKLFGMSSKKF